jgi:hypothetical protein
VAPSQAEPPAPSGIDEDKTLQALITALGPDRAADLWKYLTVIHRDWAQAGWMRLDAARRADCP